MNTNTNTYEPNMRNKSIPACNRIKTKTKYTWAAALAGALFLPLSAVAVPPPPPSGLCISTGSGSNCTPTLVAPPPPTSGTTPPTNPPPVSGNAVKWHPGHYMKVYRNAPQSDFNIIFGEPNVLGVHAEYSWRELEPQKGVYDFSRIESDLAYLSAKGKRLIIRVSDRAFSLSYKSTPDYLEKDPVYRGGISATKNGTIARIWDPAVMDRLILLYQELGARFNLEPYLEAIATQETAPGFAGNKPSDYSRSAHATQLKRGLRALKSAFPNTVVLEGANFLAGEIPGIIDNAYQIGAGALGPDLIPNRPTDSHQLISTTYKGLMPTADIVSAPVLCGKEGCNSPIDIYNYGTKILGDHYIIWVRFGTKKDTATTKYSFRYGMLPIINANPKTNSSCPKNIGICNSN